MTVSLWAQHNFRCMGVANKAQSKAKLL